MKPARLFLLSVFAASSLLAQVSTTPVPTTIESDGRATMVSTDTESTITFEKNVRVNGTNIRLTCDFLQVVVERKGDPGATIGKLDKFRSLLARGNVRILQNDREAVCGRAEVLPDQDKIVLSENPVIVFHAEESRQAGETITLYRGRREVEIVKPVATLPPLKDLGFDEDKLLNRGKEDAAKPDQPARQP